MIMVQGVLKVPRGGMKYALYQGASSPPQKAGVTYMHIPVCMIQNVYHHIDTNKTDKLETCWDAAIYLVAHSEMFSTDDKVVCL